MREKKPCTYIKKCVKKYSLCSPLGTPRLGGLVPYLLDLFALNKKKETY